MKKIQRTLMGFTVTCVCFFAVMLAGSFTKPADVTTSAKDAVSNESGSSADTANTAELASPSPAEDNREVQPDNSVTPEVSATSVPASPTPSPTETPSPTPTVSPTPTPSPSPTVTPTPTPSPTPAPNAYVPKFTIPAVTKNLNVRKGPGTDYKIIGKLPADCYAYILEEQDGWTKISTGTIEEGYVSSDYLFTPEEVISICDREQLVSASITASILNVRSGPGTWYDSIDKVKKGSSYNVLLGKSYEGWIAIELKNGTIGYVSETYVSFSIKMDTGMTLEEIAERERQEAIAKAMAKAQIFSVPETTREPMTMTEDEIYLFATVIYTEAGDQGYDGMLAVANVILNRIEYGRWGTTLAEVLFSPGQFAGARQELLDRAQARGIPEVCFDVVREALAGRNNIGDFRYFRTTDSAMRASDYLYYTKFYILNDHVFYWKNW